MLITELISALERLKREHGDLDVYYSQNIFEQHKGYIADDISYQKHILHPDYEHISDEHVCDEGILISTA